MKYHHLLFCSCVAILVSLCSCNTFTSSHSGLLQNSSKCPRDCSKAGNTVVRIQCLTKAINKDPGNSILYYERAVSLQGEFKYTAAISDFIKVIELEPGNLDAYYDLASVAALAYQNDYALYWLEKALEAGYTHHHKIAEDPSFEQVRKMDSYKSLMKKWGYLVSSAAQ